MFFVKLFLSQPEGPDKEVMVDAAKVYFQIRELANQEPYDDLSWIESLAEFFRKEFSVEYCPITMAIQIHGAVERGWEEFKKKAPQELVLHLNTDSTPTNSTPTPPPPSSPTSADSVPTEPTNSVR